jgi:ABC-type multidrug transport system ATPase subunit
MNDLHVDSVIKKFGTKQVLTDIYISCNRGEIVGLLGKNGSGKSTLLKIIFGSQKADTKFVKIGNKLIKGIFDNRNLVNYLPQDSFLPNHLKLKTIINLFCDAKNAVIISENKFIKPFLKRKSEELSGGEKRIFEIFLIIYSNAEYILIDEPFNGVAPVFKEEIKRLIQEQSKYKGFIVTDHDYRNILDIATKIILIYDGGTKVIEDINELRNWGYVPETT